MARRKWTELEKAYLSRPVLEVIENLGFGRTTPVQVRDIK